MMKSPYWATGMLMLVLGCSAEVDEGEVTQARQMLTSAGGLDAQFQAHSVWNEGICGEVVLSNLHPSATVSTWSVSLDMGDTVLQQGWSGQFAGQSGLVTVTPMNWNSSIAPGASTRFGFCAQKTANAQLPTVVAVTDDLPGGETGCIPTDVPVPQGRVEMRVSNVDDFVYLTVNGLRSKVWSYLGPDQGTMVDVSRFFSEGNNEVRVQAMNTGGPANYSIELWVDGVSVLERTCGEGCFSGSAEQGIILDETLNLSLSGLPAAQMVHIGSDETGQVYVNGQYTGQDAPATLLLPAGEYEIGLGQSVDVFGNYEGRYFKQDISVKNCPFDLSLDDDAPLPVQNRTRVAIIPVRDTYHGGSDDVGVLFEHDLPAMLAQAEATSDAWVKPFSYGLTEWDITMLPMVTDVPLHREAHWEAAPQTGRLIQEAGLEHLRQEYDALIVFHSTHLASGLPVQNGQCCIWAGGQEISYNTSWVRSAPYGAPSEGLYHESLHVYEWYNAVLHRNYNGVDGLHGGEEHGYVYRSAGEGDWLDWYRDFARGLVVERNDMRVEVTYPYKPTEGDLFVGVFDTMRWGTQYARPGVAAPVSFLALAAKAEQHPH